MQTNSNTSGVHRETEPGNFTMATLNSDGLAIDPKTLATLDTGLFDCLRKLGTPKQRICSALCLSYSEYDDIVEFLHDR